jgi:RNA polymerase sigma-70 factor (ECF subfamily)
VAIAMGYGAEHGVAILESLADDKTLAGYYLYHATIADLYRRVDRLADAKHAYERAIALCDNDRERAFLSKRLFQLG